MARDRQRAKQRKARRSAQNPGPAPTEPHRSDVPGELDHASGDVDEFDAALVAGAGGEPVDADAADDDVTVRAELDAEDEAADERAHPAPGADEPEEDFGERGAIYADELGEDDEPFEDDEPLEEDDDRGGAVATRGADRPAARGRRSRGAAAGAPHPGAPTRSGPGRLISFLQASWAELQRVQWPDRRQVFQATAVVLGFVVVAGLYLGLADRVAQEVVDLII
jgi:preprotein translocase SecE subunit